jgi:CheY-like chemotaxis protein
MMHGSIWVDSELGQGATFTFTIQAEEGSPTSSPLEAVAVENPRMLAVDGSAELRKYYSEIASRLGFICEVAADGAQALELLRRDVFDVCFVDWKTPGADSMELPRGIKKLCPESVVVLVCPFSVWNRLEAEARAAGVCATLVKPIFPSAIVESFAECLGLARGLSPVTVPLDQPRCFAGRRALLVEDVAINREIVLELLKSTSLEIECAEDGRKAVDMFSEHAEGYYNLILMDVQMPKMDGYEATRRIRALEERRAGGLCPIIAMTANVFHEDINKCLEAGMDGHLGKPINLDEVLTVLHKYL